MKTLITLGLWLLAQVAFAQTGPHSTIYIFNCSGKAYSYTLQLTLSDKPPHVIKIGSRNCAILDLATDSLSLLIDEQPRVIRFSKNTDHYFIAYTDQSTSFLVTEVSEQVFWLTANINGSKKPERYKL